MYTKTTMADATGTSVIAAVACALLAGSAAAKDHTVTIALHVRTQGLDLSRPADARTLYTRLEDAAWVVCTRGTRVDLLPTDDLRGCSEKALGDAIRAAKAPLLTQIYLRTHTPEEAAAYGIELPAQLVAK